MQTNPIFLDSMRRGFQDGFLPPRDPTKCSKGRWTFDHKQAQKAALKACELKNGCTGAVQSLYDICHAFNSLEVMLLSDIYTWKSVRQTVLKIMLEIFLKDYDSKLELAQYFGKHYRTIYEHVDKVR